MSTDGAIHGPGRQRLSLSRVYYVVVSGSRKCFLMTVERRTRKSARSKYCAAVILMESGSRDPHRTYDRVTALSRYIQSYLITSFLMRERPAQMIGRTSNGLLKRRVNHLPARPKVKPSDRALSFVHCGSGERNIK